MDYNSTFAMKPKLIRVGNSCYRRLDCDDDHVISDLTLDQRKLSLLSSEQDKRKHYSINQLENDDANLYYSNNDSENDNDLNLDDGEDLNFDNNAKRFILTIHLCNIFFGYIIGKKGQTKLQIENETQTMIKVPKMNNNPSNAPNFIQIHGANKSNVINAYRRIRNIEQSIRLKQTLTHFLSIPLSFDETIRKNFIQFRTEILSDPKLSTTKSIDESVFQSEHRLHLTLKILYLGDQFERKKASKYLDNFYENYLKNLLNENKQPNKILLQMKGVDVMNDDPTCASVLYGKINEINGNETNSLFRQIINKLYDWYSDSGLECETNRYENVGENEWKVKIHCTLMNIRYRNKNNQQQQQQQQQQPKMNVQNILEKYKQFDFGKFYLNQIHLSTIDFYDEQNHYYIPLNKICF